MEAFNRRWEETMKPCIKMSILKRNHREIYESLFKRRVQGEEKSPFSTR